MRVRSILVVDDDPEFRQVTRLNLENAGYKIATAANGLEAARVLAAEPVDLVLTDILMPVRDGLELIADLHKSHPKLPIIAMSGGGQLSADMLLQMASGFRVDGLLRKPFSKEELVFAIRAVESPMLPGTQSAA